MRKRFRDTLEGRLIDWLFDGRSVPPWLYLIFLAALYGITTFVFALLVLHYLGSTLRESVLAGLIVFGVSILRGGIELLREKRQRRRPRRKG